MSTSFTSSFASLNLGTTKHSLVPQASEASSLEILLQYDPNILEHDAYPSSGDLHTTTIKALTKAGTVETILLGTGPGSIACMQWAVQNKVWRTYEVVSGHAEWDVQQKNARRAADASLSGALNIHGKGTLHYNGSEVTRKLRNDEHASVGILLHEEVTCTCEETGISWLTKLPLPSAVHEALNLPSIHPLAFEPNLKALFYRYAKAGIYLEAELSNQVLAGILISVLRTKGLAICKDAQKANHFLSAATSKTLSYACRWFWRCSSTKGFPMLSMDLADQARVHDVLRFSGLSEAEKREQQAEWFILCYIAACKGESLLDEASHIRVTQGRKEASKIKVYSDPVKQQTKDIKHQGETGRNLLHAIVAAHPGEHSLLLKDVEAKLKILAFASEKARTEVASKLRTTLPLDANAIQLARLFENVQQDALEADLLSFTMELQQDIEEHQAKPKDTVDGSVKACGWFSKLQDKE